MKLLYYTWLTITIVSELDRNDHGPLFYPSCNHFSIDSRRQSRATGVAYHTSSSRL
jgi:hypothetical protein